MKPLLIVMLAVQVAIFLATVYTILFARASRGGGGRSGRASPSRW